MRNFSIFLPRLFFKSNDFYSEIFLILRIIRNCLLLTNKNWLEPKYKNCPECKPAITRYSTVHNFVYYIQSCVNCYKRSGTSLSDRHWRGGGGRKLML